MYEQIICFLNIPPIAIYHNINMNKTNYIWSTKKRHYINLQLEKSIVILNTITTKFNKQFCTKKKNQISTRKLC